MSGRIKYLAEGEKLEIQIKMHAPFLGRLPLISGGLSLIFVVSAWLIWTAGGIFVITILFSGENIQDIIPTIIWLAFWLFSDLLIFHFILWYSFGKEIIRIDSGFLLIRKDIFGRGQEKSFQLDQILDLRSVGTFTNKNSFSEWLNLMGLSGGNIAFEYQGKTYRFGIYLLERESRELVDKLKPLIPNKSAEPKSKMSKRISYLDQDGAIEVQIKTKKQYFLLVWIAIFLTAWTSVGCGAIYSIIYGKGTDKPEDIVFAIIWLGGWLVGEFWLGYEFFWRAFGKEIIKTTSDSLAIRREILGLGRTKSFKLNRISNLRIAGLFMGEPAVFKSSVVSGLSGGNISFDYNGKTERFGIFLSEPEAREVVEKIKSYLPANK